MTTDSAIPEEAMTDLASVARILAYRVRQDADRIGEDVRNPRLTMEHHARDLDSLADRLDKVAAALPHLRVQETAATTVGEICYNDGPPHPRTECHGDRCGLDPAPHPRPVVDREALAIALHDSVCPDRRCEPTVMGKYFTQADAVLALLPTEEGEGS